MSNNNETALLEQKFTLPTMVESDFSKEDLADDMAGMQLSFQRVKIPAGGALQFEIPGDDPESPDYARVLEGVILYNHASCAFWPEGSEYDENTNPLCSSIDGIIGIGEPGGACATCSFNAWGSGENGKGKACKNMRVLYLLRDGDYMPIQVTLPPTSLKPFKDFMNVAFAARRRATCGSVVQIGLKRVENGNTYSVATFRRLFDFSGEPLAQAKAYASGFKEQIKYMNQQRATEAANRTADDAYDAYGEYDEFDGDGDGFSVSSIGADIDGDRDALPA